MSKNVSLKQRLRVFSDVAINDSDKSFTVPDDEEWEVKVIRAELATSGDPGARRLAVEAQDGGGTVLARVQAGATQAQNTTERYNFAPGLADQTSPVSNDLNTALPALVLGPGHVLRVYDIDAIAATADDLKVWVSAVVRKVKR